MNRFAVLLAAVGALSWGCGGGGSSAHCARTVSIGWPSFLLANNVPTGCAGAGVINVEVFVDGTSVGTFPCSDGGVDVTGVDRARTFTVEGLDGAGTIVLRDDVTAGGTCTNVLVNTQPAEGTFTLEYTFTPVNECSSTSSVIWFALKDNISGDVIAVDESHNPDTYACGAVAGISFPLASGDYTLLRTEEAVFSSAAWHATGANCNTAGFTVPRAQEVAVQVAMADSTLLCP
jgi:hypothetical protein